MWWKLQYWYFGILVFWYFGISYKLTITRPFCIRYATCDYRNLAVARVK